VVESSPLSLLPRLGKITTVKSAVYFLLDADNNLFNDVFLKREGWLTRLWVRVKALLGRKVSQETVARRAREYARERFGGSFKICPKGHKEVDYNADKS